MQSQCPVPADNRDCYIGHFSPRENQWPLLPKRNMFSENERILQ